MIGIFDSGFGGLTILKGILKKLPQYDYIYLGDNARVPYGSRSSEITYEFTKQAVNYLMKKDCVLIILACNTASALALRRLQREWLPKNFPKNRILGVIRPAVEKATEDLKNNIKIGILATESTVKSRAFTGEIKKISASWRTKIKVFEQSAPLLVPIIEAGEHNWKGTDLILKKYLKPLLREKIDVLILGCTHYPIVKNKIKKIAKNIKIISEDELIPDKLADYLGRHPEIEKRLSKKHKRTYLTTDLNPRVKLLSNLFLKRRISPKLIKL